MSYFKDGYHDVISSRKVLPAGKCIHNVRHFLIRNIIKAHISIAGIILRAVGHTRAA